MVEIGPLREVFRRGSNMRRATSLASPICEMTSACQSELSILRIGVEILESACAACDSRTSSERFELCNPQFTDSLHERG